MRELNRKDKILVAGALATATLLVVKQFKFVPAILVSVAASIIADLIKEKSDI